MSGPDTEQRNRETVREFLRLLEASDVDGWIKLWADDARQYYPYGSPRMFPPVLHGRDAVYDRWKGMPDRFRRLGFPLRRTWADGDTVVAQFDGDCVLQDGTPYRNSYLALFRFTGTGEIREYWEYFDPITAGVSFGLARVSYPE